MTDDCNRCLEHSKHEALIAQNHEMTTELRNMMFKTFLMSVATLLTVGLTGAVTAYTAISQRMDNLHERPVSTNEIFSTDGISMQMWEMWPGVQFDGPWTNGETPSCKKYSRSPVRFNVSNAL